MRKVKSAKKYPGKMVSSHMADPHRPRKNTATNNRNYGFAAEAELLQHLRDNGYVAERLQLTGKEDEGDLTVMVDGVLWLVQLKTYLPRSRTGDERSPSMAQVARWLKAIKEQQKNYAEHRKLLQVPPALLIIRARGTSWKDSLIVQSMASWMQTGW